MKNADILFEPGKQFPDFNSPLTHSQLIKLSCYFADKYGCLSMSYLGSSILDKAIPVFTLGNTDADKHVLYVGAHHGMEWITSVLLLRFLNEYCDAVSYDRRIYNINLKYLFRTRCIHLIPMLNPDGVDLQINGITDENPLKQRLIGMNGGSDDFSRWQANARGVDLNHNYNAGFNEYKKIEQELNIFPGPTKYSGISPESEPETAALCNYIRFNERIKLVISLHTQGEEIYFSSGGNTLLRSRSIARMFARMSHYTAAEPEGTAAYGGLTDWLITKEKRLAFTIECGKGTNPLPIEDNLKIYSQIREILFTAPILL